MRAPATRTRVPNLGRRLLYASHGFTTHDRRFVEAAADTGWVVDYLRFDGGTCSLDLRDAPAGVTSHNWLGSHTPFSEPARPEFEQAFARCVAELSPAVVHAGPLPTVGAVAARASKVPVILMSWASDLLVDAQADRKLRDNATDALHRSQGLIVDCDTVARVAYQLGGKAERTVVVPWGVDLDTFAAREMPDSDGPLRLLSLRTLEPTYDVATLVRAVALVHRQRPHVDLHVTVAGSGSLAGELRSLATQLGIDDQLSWIGRIAEDQVAAELARAHVHVSTSVSDGSSISLLQAMACARPSIVVDNSSNREWVDAETGWIFSAGNEADLAHMITLAFDQRHALAPKGAAARLAAEQRADWRANRQRVTDLYLRVAQT